MAWIRYPGYKRNQNPIGVWNVGRDNVGVVLNLGKYNGTTLPPIVNGDVMRLFPISTDRVPLSFSLTARDTNSAILIKDIQLRIGLAYEANDEDEENQTGRFPVEIDDPFRYEEYFCTINVDSNASTRGRLNVIFTEFQPQSVVRHSVRRNIASIKDIWRRTDSTERIPVPQKLDVTVTFVAMGTNPATGVSIALFGSFPDRVAQISESGLADVLLG